MILLESNQNHATVHDTEICTTLPASMGLGWGGYVPMIIQRVYDPSRRHDYEEWEDVCGTLESRMGTGGGNVPIVVEQFVLELDATIKIGGGAASRLEEQDKCR